MIFNYNNELYNNVHCDLHKGNWKINSTKKEIFKIVIYDFGLSSGIV